MSTVRNLEAYKRCLADGLRLIAALPKNQYDSAREALSHNYYESIKLMVARTQPTPPSGAANAVVDSQLVIDESMERRLLTSREFTRVVIPD